MIDAIDEVGKSIPTKPTPKSTDLVAWLDEAVADTQRLPFATGRIGPNSGFGDHRPGRIRTQRAKDGDSLPAATARSEVALVDDAGHNVHQDQPEIVEKLLADFLQCARGRRGADVGASTNRLKCSSRNRCHMRLPGFQRIVPTRTCYACGHCAKRTAAGA
jgi:hypothetical protein